LETALHGNQTLKAVFPAKTGKNGATHQLDSISREELRTKEDLKMKRGIA